LTLRILVGIAALLALAALTGCAGAGNWARARGRDLGDCVRASVGLGVGLYAEVQATSVLHPSVGFGDVSLAPRKTVGWDPRPIPPGRVRTAAFPTLVLAWPIYRREMISMGFEDTAPGWRGFLSPLILMGSHHVEGRANSLLGLHRWLPNPMLGEMPPESSSERLSRQSWFAVSGTLGVVQADFGVNPLEIVDLLGGLVGWDVLGDDARGDIPPPTPNGPIPPDPLQNEG
jgi:hypothetical protein